MLAERGRQLEVDAHAVRQGTQRERAEGRAVRVRFVRELTCTGPGAVSLESLLIAPLHTLLGRDALVHADKLTLSPRGNLTGTF